MKGSKRGFTLVELLIVVAVVAILAAVAYPSYVKYRLRGYQSYASAGLEAVRLSMEKYRIAQGGYLATGQDIMLTGFQPSLWRSNNPRGEYVYEVVEGLTDRFRVRATGELDGDPFKDIWEIDQNGKLQNLSNDLEH